MERKRPRARRRQGRRQLLADQPGLAHSGDDHAASGAEDQVRRPSNRGPIRSRTRSSACASIRKHIASKGNSLGLGLQGQGCIRDHCHRGPPCPARQLAPARTAVVRSKRTVRLAGAGTIAHPRSRVNVKPADSRGHFIGTGVSPALNSFDRWVWRH